MSAIVNQESFLGSIIPNVYVKKISLESGGTVPVEINPHIDHEREPNVVRNEVTGKLERIPPDTTNFTKKTKQSEPLRVTIDLLLKEKLDTGLVASWFGNQDFTKYLKVQVVQSTSEEITQGFATREIPINISEIIEQPSLQNNRALKYREIPVADSSDKSILSDHVTFMDDDGNTSHDITFRVEFELQNSNPQHLACFTMAFLDISAIAKDYDLDLPPGMSKRLDGRIASELIINNHELVSQTFLFITEVGEIWLGPIHQEENGNWRTGDEESETSADLELTTIPNSKIQDFRDVKEIEKLQLDFSLIENEILSTGLNTKRLTNDKMDSTRKPNYFTDIYISRDTSGDARFLFGIDYSKMLRENAVFGKLYRDDNLELLENVRIRSLTIQRLRSSNDASGIKDERGFLEFSSEDVPDRIAVSSETTPGEFNIVNDDAGSLREIKVELEKANPGIRFFTGIDKGMSSVTFGNYQYSAIIDVEDHTARYISNLIDNLIDANYLLREYFNEASLSLNYDVASNQFTEKFRDNKKKEQIEEKNRIAEDPSISDEQAERVSSSRMRWIAPITTYLATLDILMEGFDRERYERTLISFIHPETGNPNGIQTLLKMMETLIVKMSSLIGTNISGKSIKWKPGESQQKPQSTLHRSSLPTKTFKIEKVFGEVYNADIPKGVGYDFLSSQRLDTEPNDDGLGVVSYIKYEKRTEEETLKYFKSNDEDVNLKSDKMRYTTNDSIHNSRYSFLTPSVIRLGDKTNDAEQINNGSLAFATTRQQLLAARIMRFNSLKQSPQIPMSLFNAKESINLGGDEQLINHNLGWWWQGRGVVASSIETVTKEKIAGDFIDSESVVGDISKFAKEDIVAQDENADGSGIATEEQLSSDPSSIFVDLAENSINEGITAPLFKDVAFEEHEKQINTAKVFDLQSEENALDRLSPIQNRVEAINEEVIITNNDRIQSVEPIVSQEKQEKIKKLPNQIKSLFLSSVKPSSVNKNWLDSEILSDPFMDARNKMTIKMNYKIINRIEVLAGFDTGTNKSGTQIKSPVWKELNVDRFNLAKEKSLLCRMKPYTNSELGVKCPKALELPLYNEHFILSPDEEIIMPQTSTIANKTSTINDNLYERNVKILFARSEYQMSLITAKSSVSKDKMSKHPSVNVFSRYRPVTTTRTRAPAAKASSETITVSPSTRKAVEKAKAGFFTFKLFSIK